MRLRKFTRIQHRLLYVFVLLAPADYLNQFISLCTDISKGLVRILFRRIEVLNEIIHGLLKFFILSLILNLLDQGDIDLRIDRLDRLPH